MTDVNDTFDTLDTLYGALISVARASESNPLVGDATYDVMVGGLAAADAYKNYEAGSNGTLVAIVDLLAQWTAKARAEKHRLVPKCAVCANPCGRTAEYDLKEAEEKEEKSLISAKRELLSQLGELAAEIAAAGKGIATETDENGSGQAGEIAETGSGQAGEIAETGSVPEGGRLYHLTPDQEGFFAWALFEVGYEDSADGLKEVFDTLSGMKEDTLREK